MTTKTRTHTAESRSPRRLRDQPLAFLGLFLAPFAGMLTAWLIHVYIVGFTLREWTVSSSPSAMGITVALIGAGGVVLAHQAWYFAEHRKPILRSSLAASVAALDVLFAANVYTGPHRWWSFTFVMCGWYVAVMWSIARLNVARNDKREGDQDPEGKGLLDRLGLTGYRAKRGSIEQFTDDSGQVIRTEAVVQHAKGGTIDPLQHAVPHLESDAAAPAGMTTVTATNRADQSKVTLMHVDPLEHMLPVGPPSHPGGSIADPMTFADYDTGHPVWCYLAGGPGFSASAYGWMGMTRTGKTAGENQMLTEVISRRDVVILYLNRAKGHQDIRPIIPGVEVAVISENIGDFISALGRVCGIMTYRQRQLARYGIPEWTPRCWLNPPQRTAAGEPIPMEPMPALIAHLGEADAVLADSAQGGELGLYVASKGLSLGVIAGYSLQRASAESMPTGLRFNVGTWWCFGCGDEVSAGFALSEPTIKAGAHPEHWKQSKPGYFYFEGLGIDSEMFPRRARTHILAPGMTEQHSKDEINAALAEHLLTQNLIYGPRMAKLDRGSALATAGPGEPENWWDLAAAQTAKIRETLIGGTANMTASDRNPGLVTDRKTPAPGPQTQPAATADQFAVGPQNAREDSERLDIEDEVSREIAEMRETDDGFELYPDLGGDSAADIDLDEPLPEPTPDDISFEDERPPAPGPEDARRAFEAALRQLIEMPELRDPADPDGNTVVINPTLIWKLYPFRSRPYFSGILSRMAEGQLSPPPALALARAEDLGDGKYRLSRVSDADAA